MTNICKTILTICGSTVQEEKLTGSDPFPSLHWSVIFFTQSDDQLLVWTLLQKQPEKNKALLADLSDLLVTNRNTGHGQRGSAIKYKLFIGDR